MLLGLLFNITFLTLVILTGVEGGDIIHLGLFHAATRWILFKKITTGRIHLNIHIGLRKYSTKYSFEGLAFLCVVSLQ